MVKSPFLNQYLKPCLFYHELQKEEHIIKYSICTLNELIMIVKVQNIGTFLDILCSNL